MHNSLFVVVVVDVFADFSFLALHFCTFVISIYSVYYEEMSVSVLEYTPLYAHHHDDDYKKKSQNTK